MIAVIADDLTGAAEIAGVGFRYGLCAEVQTRFNPDTKAELVVIDTDTRSKSPEQAAAEVIKVAQQFQEMPVDWIYKKVDSVMRGNIAAESGALLSVVNMRKVLLVPANPSKGRTISKGCYLINGKPLHETDFSCDPEYPATSCDVYHLLGTMPAHLSASGRTIEIGDAESSDDLSVWAEKVDKDTIAAGGAEFFAAMLENKGFCLEPVDGNDKAVSDRGLFVCGSSSDYSRAAVTRAEEKKIPVCRIPGTVSPAYSLTDDSLQRWVDDTVSALKNHRYAIVTVAQPVICDSALSQRLCHYFVELVVGVLSKVMVEDLYIEGGATASAIMRRLGWERFSVCCELAEGVVRMRVVEKPGRYLTIKPGSYPWPMNIWKTTLR